MPNLRGKTWTTTTPATVGDAQFWEDHLISDADAAKIGTAVQTVNNTAPDASGNVDVVALPPGGTTGQVLTKVSNTSGDADWEDPASGGHTIKDEDGTTMTQQPTLQFVNADVTNDSVNSKTIVDCKGAKGDAATITVGTTTTGAAGTNASVTNSGSSSAAVFDFTIPRGADGSDGNDGVSVTGVTLQGTSGKVKTYRMSFSDGNHFDYDVTDGADGTGAGDMLKTDYDSDSAVYNAGGIKAYVSSAVPVISDTYSSTSADGMSGIAVAGALAGLVIPVITNTYSATSEDGMSGKAVASAISGKADSSSLATVATTGNYGDLNGKPTIPAAQVNSDWDAVSGVAEILHKPTIPVITNTYSSSSNDGMSGVAVASAISGKADSSDLDSFVATATVANSAISFTGIDDTVNSGNCGYDVYIVVTSTSSNVSPYAKLTTISGDKTSSMSLTYETDADNGATAKLRRIK